MLRPPSTPVPAGLRSRFLAAGLVSAVAWALLRALAPGEAIPWTPPMEEAANSMARAVAAVADECLRQEIPVDPILDPNGTCLIGPEQSHLFTSLGQLEAKRTATNPDMAGLLVHLLIRAGVEAGDSVAVGASGSFPGLLVATLSAVSALGARPVTILSLGASSFGATRPGFHLGDLHAVLQREGLVQAPPVGVSLGGEGDLGKGWDPGFREALVQELRVAEGSPFLEYPDLQENVSERMKLYGAPTAFVNIGGAEANIGTSPAILQLPPGLVTGVGTADRSPEGEEGGIADLPPPSQRGVVFEMASRGVPLIHLLHVRGLALRYGLSWDPVPHQEPGSTPLADGQEGKGVAFWLLTLGYLLSLVAVFRFLGRGRPPERVRQPG